MILNFWLLTDMNLIFQIKYYRALQAKRLQNHRSVKFAPTGDWSRVPRGHTNSSLGTLKKLSDPNNFWMLTLMANYFATNLHLKSFGIYFERFELYLFGDS